MRCACGSSSRVKRVVTIDTETHDLSVYDGTTLLGHIRERDGLRTATTWPDRRPLRGPFPTRKAAMQAIGEAHARSRATPSKTAP